MFFKSSAVVLVATILSSNSLVRAISPSEIPSDTPISSLLASAREHSSRGEANDALTYYDAAIVRDPQNYLTYFRRATTYLSLGRTAKATADFDKVLSIKPTFEAAFQQRGRIKAKNGEWAGAVKDLVAHGKSQDELSAIEEAHGAAALAAEAEMRGNWDECITQSGVAIMVASRNLPLRKTRAHCRFELGQVHEGMSDLQHVLQMQGGQIEPHLKIAAINTYSLNQIDHGLTQLRSCLHSDPDSKPCKKMYRTQKMLEKQWKRVEAALEKKSYATSLKLLLPRLKDEEIGLVQEIKDEVKQLRKSGLIPELAPNELVARVVEMVCEAYQEMKNYKKSYPWCDEALALNENSLYGLLAVAQKHKDAEAFEAAIQTLEKIKEQHPGYQPLNQLLHTAQIELKRSKTKDYYKVLGVSRDADELQIKGAYRKLVRIHHPDKAHMQGISKEDAEKKMSTINEAYEVLSNPELKHRFDQGDDPNDHESQRQNPFQGSPFGGGGSPFGGGQQFNFKFSQGGGGGFPFG